MGQYVKVFALTTYFLLFQEDQVQRGKELLVAKLYAPKQSSVIPTHVK